MESENVTGNRGGAPRKERLACETEWADAGTERCPKEAASRPHLEGWVGSSRWPKENGHFGLEKSRVPGLRSGEQSGIFRRSPRCAGAGAPRLAVPSRCPGHGAVTLTCTSGRLSQGAGSWPWTDPKQEFSLLCQAIIYTSVLHFFFPCASRNPLTDLKQVERGVYKNKSLLVSQTALWPVPQSSLCLKLEEMVSVPGRNECWVFRLYNKNKIPCLCLTHALPAESSTSSMWH